MGKELRDRAVEALLKPTDDGLRLVGPKKEVDRLKTSVQELLSKANNKEEKVSLSIEQSRVFRDLIMKISNESGAEVWMSGNKNNNDLGLTLFGSDAEMAKAKELMAKVIETEAYEEKISISDDGIKMLVVNKAAKIKDIEDRWGVKITIDK